MAPSPVVEPTARPSQSKSQRAYDWIRSRIADGSYSPGFRLVLGTIAKQLDVSAVPVREAIRMLEAEGLVTFERNVGAQVAMAHPAEYAFTMQTLGLVEGYATALAVPQITKADIARARAINAELIHCLARFEPRRFTELNLEFHSVLFESCPNPHILDLVHRGWNRLNVLRESTFSFVPGRAAKSVEEHEELLGLIESGADELRVELAARNHRLKTLDEFLLHQTKHHATDKSAHGNR